MQMQVFFCRYYRKKTPLSHKKTTDGGVSWALLAGKSADSDTTTPPPIRPSSVAAGRIRGRILGLKATQINHPRALIAPSASDFQCQFRTRDRFRQHDMDKTL